MDDEGGRGGALYVTDFGLGVGPDPLIENSTFVGNRTGLGRASSGAGGALYLEHTVGGRATIVRHCTATGNAGNGGAIHLSGNPGTIENSIISDNTDENGAVIDVGTDFNAAGRNIINVLDLGVVVTGNAGGIINVDPVLAPLDFYGGPTETRHPFPASPAIDGTANLGNSPPADQRGFPRAIGLASDLGAVETYVGSTLLDGDGDQMDDRWEVLFGLIPGVPDGDEDKDGDGKPNRLEFKDFTNPCDGNSRLKIVEIKPVPGQFPWLVEVTWTSWPDRTYTAFLSQDLQAFNSWPGATNVNGDSGQTTTTRQIDLMNPEHFVKIRRNN